MDNNKRLYLNDKLDLSENNHKFTLTFISDSFLMDKYSNYLTYIDEVVLSEILGNNFTVEDFKLVRSFCRTKEIDGFNMKHKLPKNKMIGLQKGSSFYFEYTGSDYKKLAERLL